MTALALLMASAAKCGLVAKVGLLLCPSPARPDAELLSLCREVAGCDRIAAIARRSDVSVWDEPVTFKATQDRPSEALRDKARLIPRVIELDATTPAGVLAKARVVLELFALNGSSTKKAAVAGLVEDLARVLGPLPTTGNGGAS